MANTDTFVRVYTYDGRFFAFGPVNTKLTRTAADKLKALIEGLTSKRVVEICRVNDSDHDFESYWYKDDGSVGEYEWKGE